MTKRVFVIDSDSRFVDSAGRVVSGGGYFVDPSGKRVTDASQLLGRREAAPCACGGVRDESDTPTAPSASPSLLSVARMVACQDSSPGRDRYMARQELAYRFRR